MEQKQLNSMYKDELIKLLLSMGEPKFRAGQVYMWLQKKGATVEEMLNLPKPLRDRLGAMPFAMVRIHSRYVSKLDGTIKYLFLLEDGNLVEGVLMSYKYGNTMCISTQVGCRMGCAFCASTLEGLVRNLTAGEMMAMVHAVEQDGPIPDGSGRRVTNLVLMGSGEPLDNYDNVVRFLKLITDEEGFNMSQRNISVSTCGLCNRVDDFIKDAPHVTLSISLHAPNDDIRSDIMPVNRRFKIAEVISAAKRYANITGRRVIFEYALIAGVNDTYDAAKELSLKLSGINCHVNLIPLNRVKERALSGSTKDHAKVFMGWLLKRGISATIRREMGSDIDGACGQLKRRVILEQED